MYKIWITFIVTLGLALLALFFVNKNYNNGKQSGVNEERLKTIITINRATQAEVDDIMKIYSEDMSRRNKNEILQAPSNPNCIIDIEWLRKLKTLK
jgi:hypothetical protein